MGLFSSWGERQLRPGKGVSKDAPQKKAFFVFWEVYFRKFWKLCSANLLYALCTLPVLTRGLSDAGLTFITRAYAREKHAFIASDFWDTIKKNWKQSLPIGIINTLATLLVCFSVYMYSTGSGESILSVIGLALSFSVYIIFTMMKYYIPLLTITFKYNIRTIYKNAFYLVGVGWKANLLISGVLLLCYAIMAAIIWFGGMFGIMVVIILYACWFPSFRSFLIQFCIFPTIKRVIIDPYYEQHPEEDKDKRRDLGLEVEEEPTAEEDVIFVDRGETKPEEEQEAKAESKKGKSIPRQYTAAEMRRIQSRTNRADDDDTI